MIKQLQLQEQDVWEAWIEFDQFSPHFGILYIWGEFPSGKNGKVFTRKLQTRSGTQLLIQLPEASEGRHRTREYNFSESLSNPLQYESILVYSGKELVARFTEIEIVI